MAECHPVGFQWVMEAKARGAKVIHVDPRFTRTRPWPTPTCRCARAPTSPSSAAIVNYILRTSKYFREYVVAYTNAATLVREDFQDSEDLDGLFSGYDAETGTYDPSTWAYEGHAHAAAAGRRPAARRHADDQSGEDGGSEATARRQGLGGARRAPASERTAPGTRSAAAPTSRTARSSGTRRCSTRAASSRSSSGTTPATPPRWSRRCAACRRSCSSRSARRSPPTAAGSGPPPGSTRSAGPTTRSASSTSAARRSSSCCWATWAAPAAASWRCAGTPASRAPPTSRPCSTSCPATCRCRRPASTRGSPTTSTASPARAEGLLGRGRGLPVSLLKAWWGDAATAENDLCFDYLPRITGDHGTYQTVLDMLDGKVEGYFLLGQNPAVGSAHGKLQRLGMAQLKWLVVRDLQPDRVGDLLEGRAGDRDRRDRDRGDRHRGLLLPGGVAHREVRHLHPDPADAAVAPQGGRPAGRLPQRAASSSTSWAAAARAAGRLDRPRPAAARPDLGLPGARADGEPGAEAVLQEING